MAAGSWWPLRQAWCTGQGMCHLSFKGQVVVEDISTLQIPWPSDGTTLRCVSQFSSVPSCPPTYLTRWHTALPSFPSQFHFLFPLLVLPRINSYISDLYLNPCFKVGFWGNPTCFWHDPIPLLMTIHFLGVYFLTLRLPLLWFLGTCGTVLKFMNSFCSSLPFYLLFGCLGSVGKQKCETTEHMIPTTKAGHLGSPFISAPPQTLIILVARIFDIHFFFLLTFKLQKWLVHYKKFNKYI